MGGAVEQSLVEERQAIGEAALIHYISPWPLTVKSVVMVLDGALLASLLSSMPK